MLMSYLSKALYRLGREEGICGKAAARTTRSSPVQYSWPSGEDVQLVLIVKLSSFRLSRLGLV